MKNLKLELFNFKKSLTYDDSEVAHIIEGHYNNCADFTEKNIIFSLNEKLKPYMYDKKVKTLLESLNADMKQYELLYELKSLYNVLNTQNQGELYRQPINVLLQTINLENDQDRLSKVLNELAVYDWVPEIKLFVHNLTQSPETRSNLLSGGKSESVYTLVESVEDGHLAFIKDSWFLLTDNTIEKTLLENHVKEEGRLAELRTLQTALQYCAVTESRIDFRISEYLTLGLGVAKKGVVYLNDDELNAETTLESVFSSPVIPIVNKNFYPLIQEVAKNMNSFVELDVVKKVTNLVKPTLELYCFNYKNNVYVYRCDERYGYSLFKYESAAELCNECKGEMSYDLTFFYENKLSKEMVSKKRLEDKEREIELKLEDVNLNISKLEATFKTLGETPVLKEALTNLTKRKSNLDNELQAVKELQYKERVKLG
jgi:hypothetical protein